MADGQMYPAPPDPGKGIACPTMKNQAHWTKSRLCYLDVPVGDPPHIDAQSLQECLLGGPAASQGGSSGLRPCFPVPAKRSVITNPKTTPSKSFPVANKQLRNPFHRDDIDADAHHAQ